MSFDIKPTDTANRALFKHVSTYNCSLTLSLEDGKLKGTFSDNKLKVYQLETNLSVPEDRWSQVEISYDLNQIRFKVNGEESIVSLPEARALYFGPAVFGAIPGKNEEEYTRLPKFFQGDLRSFKIMHRADNH
ncbi:MAG: LamG domain-containing protein [Pseudomonadota bacterium]